MCVCFAFPACAARGKGQAAKWEHAIRQETPNPRNSLMSSFFLRIAMFEYGLVFWLSTMLRIHANSISQGLMLARDLRVRTAWITKETIIIDYLVLVYQTFGGWVTCVNFAVVADVFFQKSFPRCFMLLECLPSLSPNMTPWSRHPRPWSGQHFDSCTELSCLRMNDGVRR